MTSLMHQAELARQLSQFKRAEKIYRAILRRSQNPEEKIEAYLGLADVERIQGFFPQALEHYQRAAHFFKGRHGKTCWDAQVGWALAARASGRPREALAILQKALSVYQKEKDMEGQAFAHWALGGTYRIAGDMKKGLKELQTALRMFKTQKDADGIAYTCCALGGIYRMLGRYTDSGKYYREANRRMRRNQDTFGIAYSYCGLGNVERMGGRFKQALPFYRKAEKLYGAIGDRVSYAYTLWSLGTTYKMLGQYARAQRAFYGADNLFKETGDTRGRIYSLLGLFEIEYLKHRLSEKGRSSLKLAKSIADKSQFAWESLHIRSLRLLLLTTGFNRLTNFLKENGVNKSKIKKYEGDGNTANRERIYITSKMYKNSGSKFFPKSLPVNWP